MLVDDIQAPLPTFVRAFGARALDIGVEITWEVLSDDEVSGFNLYRRLARETEFALVNVNGLISTDLRSYVDKETEPASAYEYKLTIILGDGSAVVSPPVTVTTSRLSLTLFQNHPNPFNPTTTISFVLPSRTRTSLTVFDVHGRLVKRLLEGEMTAGFKEVKWDGRDDRGAQVASGIYFYRLIAGKEVLTRKMVLLK